MLGEAAWMSLLCSHTGLQDLHRSRCSAFFVFRIRIERDLYPSSSASFLQELE